MTILFAMASSLLHAPQERMLVYKDRVNNNLTHIKQRILTVDDRELGLMGPGDDEIIKIKAKKDMLKRKIEMDNGSLTFLVLLHLL